MIIGTVATNSHLAEAKALAQSVKSHHPEVKVVVSLAERYLNPDIPEFPHFDEVVLAKDTWQGNFDRVVFKHEAWEACCFAKASLFDYIFRKYPEENRVVLLDSEMEVLAPLDDLTHRFDRSPVLLSSQYLYKDSEHNDFKHGVCNAGLVGATRSPEGLGFVEWWKKRLEGHSYLAENDTLFAKLFNSVDVIKHPGYNTDSRNFSARQITASDNGRYTTNGEPLYVFHYHSVEQLEQNCRDETFATTHPELCDLVANYAKKLDRMNRHFLSFVPWSYGYFADGTPILRESRLVYRNNPALEKMYPDPFILNNKFFADYKPGLEETENNGSFAKRAGKGRKKAVRRFRFAAKKLNFPPKERVRFPRRSLKIKKIKKRFSADCSCSLKKIGKRPPEVCSCRKKTRKRSVWLELLEADKAKTEFEAVVPSGPRSFVDVETHKERLNNRRRNKPSRDLVHLNKNWGQVFVPAKKKRNQAFNPAEKKRSQVFLPTGKKRHRNRKIHHVYAELLNIKTGIKRKRHDTMVPPPKMKRVGNVLLNLAVASPKSSNRRGSIA